MEQTRGETESLNAAGLVLAGGASSRMGTDKALVSLGGKPLVEHALAILGEAGLQAFIAGARSSLAGFGSVIEDSSPGLGPLSGICSALTAIPARLAVFLPVDLPLIPATLIAYLLRHAQITGAAITLASAAGFPETFPSVIDRAALPALSAELDAGRSGCYSAFRAAAAALGRPLSILPVELLAQCRQASHPRGLASWLWFLNVNAPADLERAERLLFRRIA